jgi:hypothetical protein
VTSTQSRRRYSHDILPSRDRWHMEGSSTAPRTRDEAVLAAFTFGRKRKCVLLCIAFPPVFGLFMTRVLL